MVSFDFEKKKWKRLDVTKLHEIPWAEHAFDKLVLAQDERDLLLALVDRSHLTESKPFEDFIGGKGQGMIMLLCGPPGVGKTLTAERVAEHLRRPLYKLGAGDLGTDASRVERNLERALRLCAHFGAVLLMTKRTCSWRLDLPTISSATNSCLYSFASWSTTVVS